MSGQGSGRDRETESEAGSRLWPVSTESDTGLELTNCEIMTQAKVGRLTDGATQAPLENMFFSSSPGLVSQARAILRGDQILLDLL